MNKSPVLILTRIFLIDLLREKWFFGGLCVAVAIFLVNLALGSLSFDEQERIVFHLSISSIHLIGFGISLILGVSVIAKEVEKQTCLMILARPLSRGQFLLAKWVALAIFLAIFDFGLGIFLGILMGGGLPWGNLFLILLTTWLEHLLLLSLAVCAGLFLNRAVAGLMTVGVFILGHWLPDLEYFAQKSENPAFKSLSKIFQFVTPHLFEMNQRSIYYLKSGLTELQVFWSLLHAGGWTLLLFVIASWMWRRKDLV